MLRYPLVFGFSGFIPGAGFVANVDLSGRVLAEGQPAGRRASTKGE